MNFVYSLLFSSNGGGPALAPWPCAVHIRPIRVEVGVVDVDVIDEVDGLQTVAVEDGGRMPVGLGKRDDAVDTVDMSLLIDFSDGAGDGARRSAAAAPSDVDDGSGFVSLILMLCTVVFFSFTQFYSINSRRFFKFKALLKFAFALDERFLRVDFGFIYLNRKNK